ncbi:nuclease-related domain-containing protein [Nocardia sp. NPDC049220]|uniref:nuclease-related domain-containing protein n=1 Tax=Nocardia sp. NPDC049220 TaxID=3155273 RepID=UPI0033C696B7
MLVVRASRKSIPGTERQVIDWLRTDAIPGIAVSGCRIPSRHRGRNRSEEADLVVFTPQTVAVIEVKGIRKRVGGVLYSPVNGRWAMAGIVGDPVHVRASDTNPLDQASERMYDLKHVIEQVGDGQGAFVSALVTVMPIPGFPITLERGPIPMPTGCEILLGAGPRELHEWFGRAARRREAPWTVERVFAVLAALGDHREISIADLLAAGFISKHSRHDQRSVENPRNPIFAAPAPPADVNSTADHSATRTAEANTVNYSEYRPGLASVPTARSHPFRSLVVAAAALIVVGGGLWWFAAGAESGTARTDNHTPAVTSSVTEPLSPTPPPIPEAAPTQTPPPPPPRRAGCYPFQKNCS